MRYVATSSALNPKSNPVAECLRDARPQRSPMASPVITSFVPCRTPRARPTSDRQATLVQTGDAVEESASMPGKCGLPPVVPLFIQCFRET